MIINHDNFEHHSLFNYLLRSKLSTQTLIPMVEDLIKMEQASREANRILRNVSQYLDNEAKITSAEILLGLLRRWDYDHPTGAEVS